MGKDEELHKGDKVAWNASGNEVHGEVVRRVTEETSIKGHKVAASEDNPEYVVRSDKTGQEAAHRPAALTKE